MFASDSKFIGFGRIFSGTLRKGQQVYVMGPKYNPAKPNEHISCVIAEDIYILMGKGLEAIEEIPAGNVFGLGGMENHILKTATLSSSPFCSPMLSVQFSQPIVRVAVEPKNPMEMPILVDGLKKLNQADASVDVYIQESGEYVINAAGEMHLERCLRDLADTFAPIELEISSPIVSFKETISSVGKAVRCRTKGNVCQMKISCQPIPSPIVHFLEMNTQRISSIFQEKEFKSGAKFQTFQRELMDVFVTCGWIKHFEKIWAFGPKRCGPNMLFNCSAFADTQYWKSIMVTATAESLSRFQEEVGEDGEEVLVKLDDEMWKFSLLQSLDFTVTNGFMQATARGPLCEEPLSGVAFFIEDIQIKRVPDEELNKYGPLKGQIMPTITQALRDTFFNGIPHLVEPFYSCIVQVPTKWFGHSTSVLMKRRSKITNEIFLEGTDICIIEAELPVAQSFGFAAEIMKKTSGAARTQLQFSHWAILDQDPNWKPTTEDEKEEFGDNAEARGDNIARMLVDEVRKRKGLHVEEKLVEHGEKQRTLSKNK